MEKFPYQDASLPVERRVEDLLGRMTLEEKVGQMCQLDGRVNLEQEFQEKHPGSLLQILGEDCKKAIELARSSRLGIPLLLGVDAIHGHSFWPGATIFPTQLGISSSWNAELIEEMGRVTAREMRNTGVAWTFSPVLCIARDLRWGRVGETFGEDPLLIGDFAIALIRGLQGENLSNPDKVLACAKHFTGYSETQGGRDASEADISMRKLRSYFLPPFERAARAGVGSFMTGYQSMEGVPMTANRTLLRKVLKEEWGFEGLLVTDWNNVGTLVTGQKIAPDYKHAAKIAVEAGNDLIMSTPQFYQGCLDAVREGMLDEALIDEAVRRILSVKFRLGLFEDDRYPDPDAADRAAGTPEHRAAALTAARESLILLKNDGLLPVRNAKQVKVCLVGPNADNPINQCGDWSLGTGQANVPKQHPRRCTVTPKDALAEKFILVDNPGEADMIVAAVGDQPKYWGEFKSTATLELQDGQNQLLAEVADTNKPFVIAVISSKPVLLPAAVREKANAIIQQFSPGMLGGQALAEALAGELNPSGRLTVSIPYHVGQQPIYYMQPRGQHGDRYADLTQQPLYPFGYGLGYSEFEYESVTTDRTVYGPEDSIKVLVSVRNTGKRDGVEVVQAYVSDEITSATWVDQELKGYARIRIPAGETRTAVIVIPASSCSIVNAAGERVVEPGEFELRIGKSSRNILHRVKFVIR